MPTLQEQINTAIAGATITLPDNSEHVGNFVINKPLTIQGKARILSPNAAPAIDIPPNTRDVTIRDLEISTVNANQLIYDIVRIGAWQTAKIEEVPVNITFERVWIHGQTTQEVQRGIAANGINVIVKQSRITDIHGRGFEAQGIGAWNTPGPLLITENYIEAAGENIMIGGADSRLTYTDPADGQTKNVVTRGITITRNHLFKPLTWMKAHPSFIPLPPMEGTAKNWWGVKNLLEIKEGEDVVIDGNVMENCWGDAQIGFGVLITVRNQDGTNPSNVIRNVSVTNNSILNVAGGFQLIGKDWPNISQQSSRLRIANNIIRITPGSGNGRLMQIAQFNDVTFENNDGDPDHTYMNLTGGLSERLIHRNNLLKHGQYGIHTEGAVPFTDFAPGGIVTGNYIYGAAGITKPTGNTFFDAKPTSIPSGIGVDLIALKAAQSGGTSAPLPSPTPSPTPEPAPAPAPQPSPGSPSPDGTKGVKIIDARGGVWTIGDGGKTLRNDIHMGGGTGYEYKYVSGVVYVQGTDAAKNWYLWTGASWVFYGAEPGVAPQPTPTPTPEPAPEPSPTPSPGPAIGSLKPKVAWGRSDAKRKQQAKEQRALGYYWYGDEAGDYATFIYTGVKLP